MWFHGNLALSQLTQAASGHVNLKYKCGLLVAYLKNLKPFTIASTFILSLTNLLECPFQAKDAHGYGPLISGLSS